MNVLEVTDFLWNVEETSFTVRWGLGRERQEREWEREGRGIYIEREWRGGKRFLL